MATVLVDWRPAFGVGGREGGAISIQHFPDSGQKYYLTPKRLTHYDPLMEQR